METERKIALSEICTIHHIRTEFLLELHDNGLIEIIAERDEMFISLQELPKAEKLIRLHSDLNINPEGIAVVADLLEKMEQLHLEIRSLKNKLTRYE